MQEEASKLEQKELDNGSLSTGQRNQLTKLGERMQALQEGIESLVDSIEESFQDGKRRNAATSSAQAERRKKKKGRSGLDVMMDDDEGDFYDRTRTYGRGWNMGV